MKPSTWWLLAILIVLAGHWPWILTGPLAAAAYAATQPIVLAVLAAGIIAHRIKEKLA